MELPRPLDVFTPPTKANVWAWIALSTSVVFSLEAYARPVVVSAKALVDQSKVILVGRTVKLERLPTQKPVRSESGEQIVFTTFPSRAVLSVEEVVKGVYEGKTIQIDDAGSPFAERHPEITSLGARYAVFIGETGGKEYRQHLRLMSSIDRREVIAFMDIHYSVPAELVREVDVYIDEVPGKTV